MVIELAFISLQKSTVLLLFPSVCIHVSPSLSAYNLNIKICDSIKN